MPAPAHDPLVVHRSASAVASAIALSIALACAAPPPGDDGGAPTDYVAEIRRTAGGIPHIRAEDLSSLAFGTLYAMAQDDLCILAEQYLTFAAERSRHLGPRGGNRERDLFHQLLIDRGDAAEPLPPELEALFTGAAEGYNHFLATRATPRPDAGAVDRRCADATWLRPARALDLKRVSRADYALAYMQPMIVAAAPPAGEPPASSAPASGTGEAVPELGDAELARRVAALLERPREGGSNGVAIGRALSRSGHGLLLANPHMPWDEPFQRFYPMHQTIPGRLDVLGANLIGRPRVGFGHTEHVAWTSTVSTARRQTFHRLTLDPDDPTAYLFDGRSIPMRRRSVEILVRGGEGALEPVRHTFYETHFGGLLVESELFPWTREHAFAVRLVDAGWRGERAMDAQLAARSVRALKAVHDRGQFLPVNLVAADRAGEVLYADPGAIPNLPDALLADCTILGGAALDGTRSACQWRDAPGAAAPGLFPPEALPARFRTDFVTNSNDSYWLANPAAPLEGFAGWLGGERTPRTLRTRSGLAMIRRAVEARGRIDLADLRRLAFANESFAGQLIRDDVVAFCRATPRVTLADGREADLTEACGVLSDWDLHADLESRGAHLFRQMLAAANDGAFRRTLPESFVPAIAFDPQAPIATPRGLDPSAREAVLESLAEAVLEIRAAGLALDAPLGTLQSVTRGDERIPLHGGPEIEGIFNKIESRFRGAAGYPSVDRWSSSWILAVELGAEGPVSSGLLAYSLSSNPDSPHFADQTRLFSRKEWLPLPFRQADVEAATLRYERVRAPRAEGA